MACGHACVTASPLASAWVVVISLEGSLPSTLQGYSTLFEEGPTDIPSFPQVPVRVPSWN